MSNYSNPTVGDIIPAINNNGSFDAVTYGRNIGHGTLRRPSHVLKGETEMTVTRVIDGKFYQGIEGVSWIYGKVKGYRYPVVAYYKDGARIA